MRPRAHHGRANDDAERNALGLVLAEAHQEHQRWHEDGPAAHAQSPADEAPGEADRRAQPGRRHALGLEHGVDTGEGEQTQPDDEDERSEKLAEPHRRKMLHQPCSEVGAEKRCRQQTADDLPAHTIPELVGERAGGRREDDDDERCAVCRVLAHPQQPGHQRHHDRATADARQPAEKAAAEARERDLSAGSAAFLHIACGPFGRGFWTIQANRIPRK